MITVARRGAFLSLGIMSVLVGLVLVIGIAPNLTHQVEREHTEATAIRSRYDRKLCETKRVYFNPITGQIMVSCQMPDSGICGLLIWRVTENSGQTLLAGDAYECTVHAISCWKVSQIVTRDGYIGWLEVPLDLRTAIRDLHGEP